ncbi:MAG: PAS domain-containing protein, partial [Desulfobacteraceae bacterium]|nr:PAS domain-containing protein [Desulfobacteraceae bacterium]
MIVLAWFAWQEIYSLSATLESHINKMAKTSEKTTKQVADLATSSSIRALDIRSREAIEHLTTDTASNIAAFLKDRDIDIQIASMLKPDKDIYHAFLNAHKRDITLHKPWILNKKKDAWEPMDSSQDKSRTVSAKNKDNELDFHYRSPLQTGIIQSIPMYLEMTYVDVSGKEIIKITTSDFLSGQLKDISKKDQTFCKAETYFNDLKNLKPGEIYVSDVIGAHVKAHMIGPYNKKRTEKMGIEFNPSQSGYAGKENPVGKKFQGLIRWAMPVTNNGKINGYITLALDHTHVMEFTDHIVPTKERYSAISDAASGNYAFMWDYKGRNISHPRDYFIVGYEPDTGEPAIPWLTKTDYEKSKNSSLGNQEFLNTLPLFNNQRLSELPSKDLIKKGLVALDCRYLNFAPQCDGWNNLTQFGGSGSFVIHWSGLKKLTTAATIPYFTGQYSQSPRGFGFVTIGANVNEFHKPADSTAKIIKKTENQYIETIQKQNLENNDVIVKSLQDTATRLTIYTTIMVILVIFIAVWMASILTGKITTMIKGISRFQKGEMRYRLDIQSTDEMGVLGQTFNSMADSIQQAIAKLEESKSTTETSNVTLRAMLSKVIDSMPSIIIGVDTQTRVTLWNDEACKITGKNLEEVEGKVVFEVFPLLKKEKSIVFSAIEQGQKIKKEEKLKTITNNERIFYDVTVYPLIDAKIDGAVIRIDNITTRVHMEEVMLQSEKMLSVGGLAAGMAHEINNPLAGVMQTADLMGRRLTDIEMPANIQTAEEIGVNIADIKAFMEKRGILRMITTINELGQRMAVIVKNMLSFARKTDTKVSSHNPADLVDKIIELAATDYDLK